MDRLPERPEDAGYEGRDGDGAVQRSTNATGRTAVADGSGRDESKARFEVYRDDAGEWRWRLVHDNGNIIADGGEGYDRKAGARKGIASVKRNAPSAPIDVIE